MRKINPNLARHTVKAYPDIYKTVARIGKINPRLLKLAGEHSDQSAVVDGYKIPEAPTEHAFERNYSGCGCFDYLIVCDNHSSKPVSTDYY